MATLHHISNTFAISDSAGTIKSPRTRFPICGNQSTAKIADTGTAVACSLASARTCWQQPTRRPELVSRSGGDTDLSGVSA